MFRDVTTWAIYANANKLGLYACFRSDTGGCAVSPRHLGLIEFRFICYHQWLHLFARDLLYAFVNLFFLAHHLNRSFYINQLSNISWCCFSQTRKICPGINIIEQGPPLRLSYKMPQHVQCPPPRLV